MNSISPRLSSTQDNKLDPIDVRIAMVAGPQKNLITTPQLNACGLDNAQIRRRVQRGLLFPVHRGVYAVGSPQLTLDGKRLAATMALPAHTGIGGLTAVDHHAFTRFRSREIELETATRTQLSLDGASITQTRAHEFGQMTEFRGVPTTSVAWAITRLGTKLTFHQICNVINQASWRRRARVEDIRTLLDVNRSVAGHARVVRALRAYDDGSAGTKSFLEDAGVAMVEQVTKRPFVVNMHVPARGRSIEVDVYVPSLRLCIEFDGKPHDDPAQQAEDRSRDLDLGADDYRVKRLHYLEMEYRPELCLRELYDLLCR